MLQHIPQLNLAFSAPLSVQIFCISAVLRSLLIELLEDTRQSSVVPSGGPAVRRPARGECTDMERDAIVLKHALVFTLHYL